MLRTRFRNRLWTLPIGAFTGIALALSISTPSARSEDAGAAKSPVVVSKDVQARALAVLRDALKAATANSDKPDDFIPPMHAAEALTYAGYQAEVREKLGPILPEEKLGKRRCGWARELVRAGDLAPVADLLDVLASKDENEQIMAAESLYKIGEIGDGAQLRRMMEQCPKPVGRMMAAGALARSGNLDALRRIRAALKAEDADSRAMAVWLLGRIGDKSDVPALTKLVGNERDDLAKNFAFHALAFLGDADGATAVERNLTHPVVDVRSLAAETAGLTRNASLIPKLVKTLDDPVLDVRVRAAEALLFFTTELREPCRTIL